MREIAIVVVGVLITQIWGRSEPLALLARHRGDSALPKLEAAPR